MLFSFPETFRLNPDTPYIGTGIRVRFESLLMISGSCEEAGDAPDMGDEEPGFGAGDFLKEDGHFGFGSFTLKTTKHRWTGETIPLSRLESIDIASEDNVKKIGGTIGWGAAGGLILGPVGLLAGLLLGGKKKEVTFVAKFNDGRKLLATTDSNTYIKLQAAVF